MKNRRPATGLNASGERKQKFDLVSKESKAKKLLRARYSVRGRTWSGPLSRTHGLDEGLIAGLRGGGVPVPVPSLKIKTVP